ncbi:stage III sporulation protein AF [Caldinitratiruptor microaerophilus]|uniref:Stage III sporulation protein AF n=1 Tax=Caldinitratiruptor microaerophilus TaxID=671077 RepID=A0AA35CM59_9FIRM|nr:stage III sporulation protein AF [Caldinitratiruptor microaerophilus]BDG59876.1 hypothetical protein caldi_09660 [Caldinitratiruptor microaerophilus]
MDALREMARSLVILAVLALGLEMALPQGAMRPYVRATVGLLAMLVILDPVLALARRPVAALPAGPLDPGSTRFPTLEEIAAATKRLRQENEGLIAREFGEQVRRAAERAARALPGVASARADVHLGPPEAPLGPPKVTLVRLEVRPGSRPEPEAAAVEPVRPVEPVRVGAGEGPGRSLPTGPPAGALAREVQRHVSAALGLPASRVLVTVREAAPAGGP